MDFKIKVVLLFKMNLRMILRITIINYPQVNLRIISFLIQKIIEINWRLIDCKPPFKVDQAIISFQIKQAWRIITFYYKINLLLVHRRIFSLKKSMVIRIIRMLCILSQLIQFTKKIKASSINQAIIIMVIWSEMDHVLS